MERQIKDLSARYDKQSDMESGGFPETETSVLGEHSTAVPFSAALLTSVGGVATSVRKRFHSKPKGQDLEAGPESDCEDKETAFEEAEEKEEKKRQTPEDIV